MRSLRVIEGEKKEKEINGIRVEIEQYKNEVKTLISDKSTLIKKFKEY